MEGLIFGILYSGLQGQNTSQNPKHAPNYKTISRNSKKRCRYKTRPRIQKHPPESKNTSQKPNSRTWFGFWGAFCPHKAPYFWLVTQDHKLQVKTICSRCSKGHPCKPFLFYVACKTVIKVTRKNFRVHMKESWLWGVSFPSFPSVF